MDKYLQAEMRLAKLKRPDCVISDDLGTLLAHKPTKPGPNGETPEYKYTYLGPFMKWARDNDAAFELMVEYGIKVCFTPTSVSAERDTAIYGIGLDGHDDREAATRYAIVMAATDFLEKQTQ